MKEIAGQVFSIEHDNQPVEGCTISKCVHNGQNVVTIFSMAKNTDISAETFPYYKLIYVNSDTVEAYLPFENSEVQVGRGQSYLAPVDVPVGFRTSVGSIFTEITIRKDDFMNEAIHAGEVFKLEDKLPYADGKIVNMDVVHNDKMKFALMAFDAGEGLSEHSAPGEALIFALEGEGEIGYEGTTFPIKAGENFHFAKNGKHWVKAKTQFKMALLLTLD